LIRDGVSHHHNFPNEIHRIRQLLLKDLNVVIDHTLQERNACTDVLAKLKASSTLPMVVLETPPSELSSICGDVWGVIFGKE
jgi:hypothetical protein